MLASSSASWPLVDRLSLELRGLDARLAGAERQGAPIVDAARREWRETVRNLIHYLALRQFDVRKLQLDLAELGLSSLGRAEGYVRGNLRNVRRLLACLAGREGPAALAPLDPETPTLSRAQAEALLHAHTRALLGPKPPSRHVYVMVTAPEPSAADDAWFERMIDAGMNLLRINAAHGRPADWRLLAERARRAAARTGRSLRLAVDLPGPKLRTTALLAGPRVLKLKPARDAYGRVLAPCRVRLGPPRGEADPLPTLPVPAAVVSLMAPGDLLAFRDARGRARTMVVAGTRDGAVGELTRKAYIVPEAAIDLLDAQGTRKATFLCTSLPAKAFTCVVEPGDSVAICADPTALPPACRGVPAFGCTLPEVLGALKPGMAVMIDDGKITGRVSVAAPSYAVVKVERAAKGRAKIRGDMGLNLPDVRLAAAGLTAADREALRFAEEHADIVSLSFVRSAEDVRDFERALRRRDLGLILKIETRAGFAALPSLLLEFLGRHDLGVMIARGDLAVEIGYARLAEVQEEILWLCEAAHVPVIWATQVLETLAKTGVPTRSEVTDAAMSVRAECVMLNKGPFIEDATRMLDSILTRMESHQFKKRHLYRRLQLPVPSYVLGPPA